LRRKCKNSAGAVVDIPLNDETVPESLNAVSQMIFPFRSLETKKQWMQHRMQKPKELSILETLATARKLNYSLPVFPKCRETGEFLPEKSRDNRMVNS
jgi:hypothetical protein